MEHSSAWKLKVLTDELAQGMEKAMQLRFHLCSTSPSEAEDLLLQRIISTFEKALCILKCGGAPTAARESSVSADESSRSEDLSKNFRDYHDHGDPSSKKR